MATDRIYIVDFGRLVEKVNACTQKALGIEVELAERKGSQGLYLQRADGMFFTDEQDAWLSAFSEGLEIGIDIALEGDVQI